MLDLTGVLFNWNFKFSEIFILKGLLYATIEITVYYLSDTTQV